MTYSRNNHGSVLLMVIGILTMIAILGSAFLLVSHADAQQSAALTNRSQVDPIARTIVTRLESRMQADLFLDPACSGGINTAGSFVADPNFKYADPNLTFPTDANFGPFRNLGTGGPNYWLRCVDSNVRIDSNSDSWVTQPFFTLSSGTNVDVVGSTTADCILYDTGITNALGTTNYFVATKVTDLCALINVNVASSATDGSAAHTPSGVQFNTLLNQALATSIQNARRNNTGTEADYIKTGARYLLQPNAIYRPFMISDEAYLRWQQAGSAPETGPLGAACAGSLLATNPANRNYLTTFSANGNLRRPDNSFTSTVNMASPVASTTNSFYNKVAIEYGSTSTADAKYNEIYRQAYMMLNDLNIGVPTVGVFPNMRQQMAMCFTANLMTGDPAYTRTTIPTNPYVFSPKTIMSPYNAAGGTDTLVAYGTVPDLVIAKAYASQTVLGTSTSAISAAVELYNPTSMDANLTDYQLWMVNTAGSTENAVNLPSGVIVPKNGGRVVVYSSRKKTGAAQMTIAALGEANLPPTFPCPSYRLESGSPLTNALEFYGSGAASTTTANWQLRLTPKTNLIYTLDMMDGTATLAYNMSMSSGLATTTACTPSINKMSYRDYVTAHQRYMTPSVFTLSSTSSSTSATYLGAASPAIDGTWSPTLGVPSGLRLGPYPVSDVGDLMSIPWAAACSRTAFAVGGFTSFGTMMQNSALVTGNTVMFTSTYSGRGRLDPLPSNVNYGGYNAYGTTGKYPDVPAACLLSDYFTNPADINRGGLQQYGKININTASDKVLGQLPLAITLPFSSVYTGTTGAIITDANDALNCIIGYRDMKLVKVTTVKGPNAETLDFSTARAAAQILSRGAGITGLRATAGSNVRAYLTEAEVAIPLGMYCDALLKDAFAPGADSLMTLALHPDYAYARDALYRAISNMITVRSDVYAINIRVQLGKSATPPPNSVWYYVAVLDRSNCRAISDQPRVVLFTQVK